METYAVFKDLAIILVSAKILGLLARKMKVPQVVGEIVAGLLIGPSVLGLVGQTSFLTQMAEIGVILLMFSAGLGTNLKNMIKTGPFACLVAVCGVAVPLILGTLLYMLFYGFAAVGSPHFYKAVFIGVILTATSVSITVQTLSELGKLKSKLGTAIVSAAIIDDVIGIMVLTVVIGIGANTSGASAGILSVIMRSLLFFVFSGVLGYACYKLFKALNKKYSHTQRIPIFGLALCMFMAYAAEKYFGVADVTGAFVAGIILCNINDAEYIERKMAINSYILFGPVFFAGIGLKTDIHGISGTIVLFSICFVLVALVSKIIGCGLVSRICKYSWRDSLIVGVGMMTRGEVALIVAQKGLSVGLLDPIYFTPVIILIIVSSILTPIFLKLLFAKNMNAAAIHELSA
ncbi:MULTISPECIES: cation:proton antiporter [Congzhengia]|uniref:Cation:proton antiporter n=1 Tax=Congzhengia minquanensis TaxID=2763657 RepID=A0A926DPU3_9FIRM|nr:cation:proton antiporter [Congzhengia minquanensis]MBC8541139.1 cation:proton antiporter [Congzhengia minquanensis]